MPRSSIRSAPVSDLFAVTALAPRQAHKALTLWPLVLPEDVRLDAAPVYVPLADALAAGTLRVDELASGATVPHVEVENLGEVAVLVLFGEQIRGAMQNRVANASFLVGPHARVRIDVSCVEAGRWQRRRAEMRFSASKELLSHALRRKMAHRVSEHRRFGNGGFQANQGEVWEEVGHRLAHARVSSGTAAYADYVDTRGRDLREIQAAFRPVPRQLGFVAAIGEEIAGVEIVGRPEIFASVFEGLVQAYAIDAVDHALVRQLDGRAAAAARFDEPEAFLAAVSAARTSSAPSLGLGEDVRLEGGGVQGCALVAGDVVHLTAFPAEVA